MDEPREKHELEDSGHPDALVLYRSLVWEGVLPDGFDKEFQKFYAAVAPAAERQRQSAANVAAAGWLSEHKRKAEALEKARPHEPTLAEVVAATAGRVPKTFKSRLQRGFGGFRLWRSWSRGRPRRWVISLHVSQAVLLWWESGEEQLR